MDVPTVATAAATDSGKPENTSIKAINIELERKNFFCFVKLSIQCWPGNCELQDLHVVRGFNPQHPENRNAIHYSWKVTKHEIKKKLRSYSSHEEYDCTTSWKTLRLLQLIETTTLCPCISINTSERKKNVRLVAIKSFDSNTNKKRNEQKEKKERVVGP